MRAASGRLPAAVLALLLLVGTASGGRAEPAPTGPAHVPVYAYFYQWYTEGSWNRAKQDFPLAGRYDSSDVQVLRAQVRQARAAGIEGFLTSWKSTVTLNRRLALLTAVAEQEQLDLGIVYEALDFSRRPLPISVVKADLLHLAATWKVTSRFFSRPVVIWTGTDDFSVSDVAAVHAALAGRVLLLAAAKQVAGYERVADVVDGEAYYWSSADPRSAATAVKLKAMAKAVHAHHGTWLAPAAPGFDGRTLGHTRVVERQSGGTLRQSLDNAFGSNPDAVGVISWNEWSENTYIEPGERYGRQDLDVLARYLKASQPAQPARSGPVLQPTVRHDSQWSGLRALAALLAISVSSAVVLTRRRRRSADVDQPVPYGEGGGLEPRVHSELHEHVLDVRASGVGADEQ